MAAKLSIPKDVADLLGNTPEEVQLHVHEILVLSFYREHKISSGRAAEMLGMDLLTFIRWSGERGVPFIDMTPEEWQEELRTLDKMGRADPSS